MDCAAQNRIGKMGLAIAAAPWLAYAIVTICALAGLPGFS